MTENKDFQAVNEIGKIFNSFLDKSLLGDFFLESSLVFVKAREAYLFLAGNEDKLWTESSTQGTKTAPPAILQEAQEAFREGKNRVKGDELYIPLIVRNAAIGVACFCRDSKTGPYSETEIALGVNLASLAAAALKNILLFEQNIKMERLAAIGQTMGMVLHEIKNIVQLATFAQHYLKSGFKKQDQKLLDMGVKGFDKAVREMDGFIYEILSLTKDYKISPVPVLWPDLLNELKEDLEGKAKQYSVSLETECPSELGTIEGEPKSLYRALLNLAKNSIEASDTEKKSFTRVRVLPKDADSYEISVEDNGKGMSEETKAKLFQAFFSTKGEKGTGLGLLIIDRTIKAHHGKISLESEEGKGTKFTLTLPKTLPR